MSSKNQCWIESVEITVDDKIMRGYLHHVADSQNVVVMLHGFTGHKAEAHYAFKRLADRLGTIGVAALRIDYIGCGDSDGVFTDLDYHHLIVQAQRMIAWVRAYYAHVHLLGFSLGGAVALGAVDETIASLVLIAPALNMAELIEARMASYPMLDEETVDLDGLPLHSQFLKSLQSKRFEAKLADYQDAVSVIWGTEDVPVPMTLLAQIQAVCSHARIHCIKGADHTFSSVPYLEAVFRYVCEHFLVNMRQETR